MIGPSIEEPATALLGAVTAAAALGFLTLNWSPAKIFMGDAGSTLLGFIFAVAPVLARAEGAIVVASERLGAASVLLVWPFLADGLFTVGRRLRRWENLFVAHRSHIYQRLVISGVTHAKVATVYGVEAIVTAGLAWTVMRWGWRVLPFAMAIAASGFIGLWFWAPRREGPRGHIQGK